MIVSLMFLAAAGLLRMPVTQDFRVETVNMVAAVPLLDAPGGSTEVKLRWASSDGQVGTTLIDDGFAIALEVRAGARGDDCTSRMAAFAAGTNEHLRKLTRQNLAQLLAMCPRVTEARKAVALAEFRSAAREYRLAADLWRAQSRTAFGASAVRCVELAPPPATCSRWSGKGK